MVLQLETRAWQEGRLDAKICLILEAPSYMELRLNRPCVAPGPSGEILSWSLLRAKLLRRDLLIANLFKYGVTKNPRTKDIIHPETHEVLVHKGTVLTDYGRSECQWCLDLIKLWADHGGQVLVPAGGPALNALTHRVGIKKWRGSPFKDLLAPWTIPTIHPAACLERGQDAGGAYHLRNILVEDLEKIKRFSQGHRPLTRKLITFPSFDQVNAFFDETEKHRSFATDVEVSKNREEITCFSVAYSAQDSICIPITESSSRPYWSESHELLIWQRLARLLTSNKEIINQNLIFDLWIFLKTLGLHFNGPLADTMIGFNIMLPDFPQDLGFITSVLTDEVYYKDDGKVWEEEGRNSLFRDPAKFFSYSAMDSAVAFEAWKGNSWHPGLYQTLHQNGFWPTYLKDIRKYGPLLDMMTRGVKVDEERLKDTAASVADLIETKTARLHEMVGYALNVSSTAACQRYFYDELGLSPYTNKKTGNATLDKKALARIARKTTKGAAEAALLQEIRQLLKFRDSYGDVSWDDDGRIRCSWRPRGTIMGRLSSGKTIYDRGLNYQNLTPAFKSFLIADEDEGAVTQ